MKNIYGAGFWNPIELSLRRTLVRPVILFNIKKSKYFFFCCLLFEPADYKARGHEEHDE
jgi:hypothetical protein